MQSLDQIFNRPAERAEIIDQLRAYLARRRDDIKDHHRNGASGRQVVGFITAMMDDVLQQSYRRALMTRIPDEREVLDDGCVLLALGGYGRKELNPHSDIDLMFLYREEVEEPVEALSKEILHLLWDMNFSVGHSFRTVRDAVEIGAADYTVRTAMMESRIVAGSEALHAKFQGALRRMTDRDVKGYIAQKLEEMRLEQEEYGSTVYLLEPNVKRSEGGLRDIHYLRWIGMARYRCATLAQLHQEGLLSNQDYISLGQGQDFLWRVRNELHFHSDRATDILSFEAQEHLAGFFGFENTDHLLAVERFMQQYYIHTARIHDIASRFIEGATSPPLMRRLFHRLTSRQVEGFHLTPAQISLSSRYGPDYLKDGVHLVNLFLFAKEYGVRVSKETLEQVSMVLREERVLARFNEACGRFRLLLSRPGHIAGTLRAMHRTQLLWRFIPEYERVHRLVQFNRYHKYTVDEHSIRAVEEAESLMGRDGILSEVYREIKRKEILHLSLLLHDVGKGLAGDHSEEGVRIAREISEHLHLTPDESHLLLFLVEKHLMMAHIAFRRDLSDPKVIFLFAQEVRTSEVLRMLLILTYADISAVGPGTWSSWKGELLTELYGKTLEELTGKPSVTSDEQERIQEVYREVKGRLSQISPDIPENWITEAFDLMNRRYILLTPIDRIVRDLQNIHRLAPRSVYVEAENDSGTLTTRYTIYTFDDIIPGLFSKIAGVLAARGLQILDAQVDTRRNGVVVDTFRVSDRHYNGSSPPQRLAEVKEKIADVLLGKVSVEALFPQKTLFIPALRHISPKPTTVEIDNETSDDFTIIDIFAQDKQGLLYVITRTIFELGLRVYSSKIATRLDQIVDVFYVQVKGGGKITDPDDIRRIKERISEEIRRFHEE